MINHIYDHNWQPWRKRVSKINGALTYSQDICDWYLPYLQYTVPDKSMVVSTCAPFSAYAATDVLAYNGQYDILVQFLHTYPKSNPLRPIEETQSRYGHKFKHIMFVTAYQKYADTINDYGRKKAVSAKFLPMRIGKAPGMERKGKQKRQAVWFGNVYAEKQNTYRDVVKFCRELKIDLITIREGKMYDTINTSGRSVSQAQAWQICANAGVVFAVGRCALEAYSMGCRVIVAGDSYGGTVKTPKDWDIQESTNFNSRLHTGWMSMLEAIEDALWQIESGRHAHINDDKILCESLVSSGLIQWK